MVCRMLTDTGNHRKGMRGGGGAEGVGRGEKGEGKRGEGEMQGNVYPDVCKGKLHLIKTGRYKLKCGQSKHHSITEKGR